MQRGKTASPCFPVTVLTTVTKNREQEVMLSSPVSLAPPMLEQSRCHTWAGTRFGYNLPLFNELYQFYDAGLVAADRPRV
jgi:hypothetical protein